MAVKRYRLSQSDRGLPGRNKTIKATIRDKNRTGRKRQGINPVYWAICKVYAKLLPKTPKVIGWTMPY